MRQEQAWPLLNALHGWPHESLGQLSAKSETTKAIRHMLNHQVAITRYVDDGRIEIANNFAEQALQTVAPGWKNWLYCGSEKGGERAEAMYSLIGAPKMNDLNPFVYLRLVLAHDADYRLTASPICFPRTSHKNGRPTPLAPTDHHFADSLNASTTRCETAQNVLRRRFAHDSSGFFTFTPANYRMALILRCGMYFAVCLPFNKYGDKRHEAPFISNRPAFFTLDAGPCRLHRQYQCADRITLVEFFSMAVFRR